ncbi:hypothetical protein P3747_24700, partial [Vibrio parahaemolyticus]|nr:hypothetical protein [Vibrio parahaemolyticus]
KSLAEKIKIIIMDFKALFDKLKRSSSGGRSCFLVIQPDAVYLSSSIKSSRPYQFDISESNWLCCLIR